MLKHTRSKVPRTCLRTLSDGLVKKYKMWKICLKMRHAGLVRRFEGLAVLSGGVTC